LPVILAGDFNSRADGTGTATYATLIGAGFDDTWTATHPGSLGNTWGHAVDLRNTTVDLTQRLDLVLYRGDLSAERAVVVGEELADRTASGLWPSDHAGVVATLELHARPAACDSLPIGALSAARHAGRFFASAVCGRPHATMVACFSCGITQDEADESHWRPRAPMGAGLRGLFGGLDVTERGLFRG
jgi:hypothetical protein